MTKGHKNSAIQDPCNNYCLKERQFYRIMSLTKWRLLTKKHFQKLSLNWRQMDVVMMAVSLVS